MSSDSVTLLRVQCRSRGTPGQEGEGPWGQGVRVYILCLSCSTASWSLSQESGESLSRKIIEFFLMYDGRWHFFELVFTLTLNAKIYFA